MQHLFNWTNIFYIILIILCSFSTISCTINDILLGKMYYFELLLMWRSSMCEDLYWNNVTLSREHKIHCIRSECRWITSELHRWSTWKRDCGREFNNCKFRWVEYVILLHDIGDMMKLFYVVMRLEFVISLNIYFFVFVYHIFFYFYSNLFVTR